MRCTILFALSLWPSLAAGQGAPPTANTPAASASACKAVCELGEKQQLNTDNDKTLYFSCFIGSFCGTCKEPSASGRICNPVAHQPVPPAGSPIDILQRMLPGRV